MRIILTIILFLAGSLGVRAGEAVTYSGKLGKLDIIVELSGPIGADRVIGRYAYMAKGVDIPLRGKVGTDGFTLAEEKPCTKETCIDPDGMPIKEPPFGADWTLAASADGKTLEGTWRARDKAKTLPIQLTRVGERTVEANDDSAPDVLDPSYAQLGETTNLTSNDLPYDFLRMEFPLVLGEEVSVSQGTYKMATDPRTGMAYPLVTRIEGADIAPVNAFLAQQRLQWNLNAFSCLAKIYLGNGYYGGSAEGTTGTDGGGEVKVLYLTDRLIGLEESGSFFCGSAHPNNFDNHVIVDVKTGLQLTPETLLKDWVAKDFDGNVVDPDKVEDRSNLIWSPGEALLRYVNEKREKFDEAFEKECDIPSLIGTNLGIYFKDDKMVFNLKSLEYAIMACGSDLLAIPIKDAKPLLKPEALGYFAVFDQ